MNGYQLGTPGSAERRMFLLALKTYSDSCDLPDLSPECPFYEKTSQGPTCGEQCLDILAVHRDEVPPGKVWDLGNGMAAYARSTRKSRRGPESTARPFDAVVFQARDKDKPTDTKHTISLIKDLADLLAMPPQLADDAEERSYLIRACIDELVSRGFDRQDLYLAAVYRTSFAMVGWMIISEIATNGLTLSDSDGARLEFDVPDEWHDIAREVVSIDASGPSNSISAGDTESLVDAFLAWNLGLELDSVTSWAELPPASYIRQHSGQVGDPAFIRANWLMDRFTRTYPDSWRPSSLDMEWKYMHGDEVGCCDSTQMRLRRLSREEISVVLADRAVRSRGRGKRSTRKFGGADFTQTAIGLLSAGKHDSAVAMYEALHKLDPNDPELLNNLGFCLIPTYPERALYCLNQSAALSTGVDPVTWANRVAVLHLLGQDSAAYELARQGCDNSETTTAWLWLLDDSRKIIELGASVNVGVYVSDLESRIAADSTE